jgi:transcription antitermination factor NusG
MRRLRQLEIAHYGPLIARRHPTATGRVRTAYVPLFPGYVFLQGDEATRYRAMATNCISRCLAVPDPAQLVHDLRQIFRLIESNVPLTPEARIEPGTHVRIRSGMLAGLEGTVVRRRGETHLFVAVDFLQKGASFQLADYQVEALDGG